MIWLKNKVPNPSNHSFRMGCLPPSNPFKYNLIWVAAATIKRQRITIPWSSQKLSKNLISVANIRNKIKKHLSSCAHFWIFFFCFLDLAYSKLRHLLSSSALTKQQKVQNQQSRPYEGESNLQNFKNKKREVGRLG